ncbi:MAG: HIT domain-containing protein [Dechloromonas sp.]|nr:HIT domain-containing protein [Dechloromonas sp.]
MPCKFCEIGGGLHQSEVDHPMIESDRYFAVSSIGGFVPGWTLVFPKEHRFNMSCDYRNPEFNDFVRKVSAVVCKEYGSCVFFEHGAVKQDSQTGCGVNHAHFHIVPLSKSIETLATAYKPNYVWQKTQASEIQDRHNGAEYLFCCDEFGGESKGVISILRNPESQFFRKVIASAAGLDGLSDYKKFPFDELSTDTAVRLHRSFAFADATA